MSDQHNGGRVVELDPAVYERFQAEQDRAAAAAYDDFDAFWLGAHEAKPTKIRGVLVKPPNDLPLALVEDVENVMGSTDLAAIHRVVRMIFGEDILGTWISAGMGLREFQTVLAWAGAHMRGKPVTFAEAMRIANEALDALEAEQGKAPANRAERRARKKKDRPGRNRSAATGG